MFSCTLPDGVLDTVNALFPNGKTPDPALLGNLAPVKLFIPSPSRLNFTFVLEGAGYRNQFGYFLYNQTNPAVAGVASNFTTVFPDVSNPRTGGTGCLLPGYTTEAGPIPGGVFLGFWVIANGYGGGTDRWVSFTDGATLRNVDGKNHTAFVYISNLTTTLFGFEDLNGLGDSDYNDVMFTFSSEVNIDLDQIPNYDGGVIQTCRVGIIATQDYLEYQCQQWALMSPPSGAACNSFLTPPTGWTFAMNTSETLQMLRAVGGATFSRTLTGFDELGASVDTGCAVVRLTTTDNSRVSYTAAGLSCDLIDEPRLTPFGTSTSCFSTQCNNRVLIRGGAVASCSISTNEYCDPTVSSKLVNRVPSVIPIVGSPTYATTQLYPTSANVFLAESSSLNLNVSVILKSAVQGGISSDIYIMFDMMNAFVKDKDYLSQGLVSFYNEMINKNTIGFDLPNIGFGTFRRTGDVTTFTNNCPLSPDVLKIRDCIVALPWGPGSATVPQDSAAAARLAMDSLIGQFRSFAYKVVVVMSDNPTITSSITALRTSQLRNNIVPLFFSPNPISSGSGSITPNYTAIVNGVYLARRYSGTNRVNSNLGIERMNQWFSILPGEIKRLAQNLTFARMEDTAENAIANGFLRSIPSSLDVAALPVASQSNTFNRLMTLGWPSGTTVALSSFPIKAIVTVLGFGRTEFTISTNRAPTAPDTPVSTDEDTTVNFAVSAADIDSNLMRITFLTRTNAALGNLLLESGAVAQLNTQYNNTLNFRYVPTADMSGTDVFTFVVSDGCLSTPVRTLTIEVRPVNDAPVARNFTIVVNENDASLSNIAQIVFNETYISDIDTLFANLLVSFVSVPDTTLGDLADGSTLIRNSYSLGTKRSATFTPLAYKSGTTSFVYRVSDGFLSADATVTIVVVDRRWPPVLTVTPNPVTANAGNVTTILVSVFDPDGFDASYAETATISASSITLLNNNGLTIWNQTRALSSGSSNGVWTSPISVPTTAVRTFEITWTADNAATAQSLTLVATDANSMTSNAVVLRLIVSGNRPPRVVNHPATLLGAEDTSIGPFTLQATDDDFALDANVTLQQWRFLSISFTTLPSNGVLRVLTSGSEEFVVTASNANFFAQRVADLAQKTSGFSVRYTPNANFNGQDTFTYTFSDEFEGISSPATTVITVTPTNDQPTTSSFSVTLNSWNDPNVPVSAIVNEFSAFDIDADPISLEILTLPTRGTLKYRGVAVVESELPLNVGRAANWTFTYEPPFLGSSDPDGSVYSSFNFRVCDNAGAPNSCSETATVSLIVNFVNTPPLSNDFDVYTDENVAVSFVFPARDPDLPRHNDTVLFAVVTSLGARNKGQLYLCAEMTEACELTVDRVNEPIAHPRRVWYKPLLNDYSTAEAPSATLRFQVGDETLNTAFTYTVNVFVNFVNDPPEWRAETTYSIDEDTTLNLFTLDPSNWYDDLLLVPSNQVNPPVPVVTVSVQTLPLVGTLSTCNATGCTALTAADLPARLDDSLGRILYTPVANEYGQGYASFVFNLKDSGVPFGPSRTTPVLITVHVLPVNDAPVISTEFPTVAQGGDGPIIDEDSFADLAWRLTDVDTLPHELVTRVRTSSFTRSGWSVLSCVADEFSGCNPGAKLTDNADNFAKLVLSYRVVNTTCNLVEGKPITDFSGCYAEFLFRFVPEPNRYQIPFIQLSFSGFDRLDEADPAVTVVSVLPVNDAPVILAPSVISPSAGVSEMEIVDDVTRPPADFQYSLRSDTERTKGVFVWDSDANPAGAIERLTVEIIDGDGVFLPHPALNCNQTSDMAYECETTINVMNKRLKESKFRVAVDLGFMEATVRWTINDLGNTSPEDKPTPLSNSTTTKFVFTKLPEIGSVPQNGNQLTLAAGIAAAAGLVLIALLAWRLRKSLKTPNDDYFAVGTSAISVAPTNPLFKPQFQDHQNPLYAAT